MFSNRTLVFICVAAAIIVPLSLVPVAADLYHRYGLTERPPGPYGHSKVTMLDETKGTLGAQFFIDSEMAVEIERQIKKHLHRKVPIQTLVLNSQGGGDEDAKAVIDVLHRYPDIQVEVWAEKMCSSSCDEILGDAVVRNKAYISDNACMLFHTGVASLHYQPDKAVVCALHTDAGANIMIPWLNNLSNGRLPQYIEHCKGPNPLATINGIEFDGRQVREITADQGGDCTTHETPTHCVPKNEQIDCSTP